MRHETFVIPQPPGNGFRFTGIGHRLACSKCGRKILVEVFLSGIDHTAGIHATCAECLELSPEFAAAAPDVAREVEEWKKP